MAKTARKKAATEKPAKTKAAKASRDAGSTSRTSKSLKPGDKVAWGTAQGRTTGRIVKKQTTPTRIKTHKVAASKANPEFIVESAKSGKRAAHKPSELRKV